MNLSSIKVRPLNGVQLLQASIHAHGSNGFHHTPASGSTVHYKPPSVIALSDKDTFTIRKKMFRFEYGLLDEVQPSTALSPVPFETPLPGLSVPSVDTNTPGRRVSALRRRASHRMSLVPAGGTFVPLSPAQNRRRSTIGTGGLGASIRAPNGKSGLSAEMDVEEAVEEEVEEMSVVDVVDGEEGDLVYLETKDCEGTGRETQQVGLHKTSRYRCADDRLCSQPIYERGFMTPQQTRKAPPRNTSVVPRTRKLFAPAVKQPTNEEEEGQAQNGNDPEPAVVPGTPRSISLPPASDTPYEAPKSRVTAQVALSTPRGPASLRKALLLRSARKIWEQSRSLGLEGAIEAGDIEVRRKSLSPKARTPKKDPSINDEYAEREDGEQGEMMDVEEEEEEDENGELQWVYEDGRAEGSVDESDPDMDSLEADVSLDVVSLDTWKSRRADVCLQPGQNIMTFTPPRIIIGEDADMDAKSGTGEEQDEEGEYEEEEEEEEELFENGQGEAAEEPIEDEEEDEVEMDNEDEMENEDETTALQDRAVPATPIAVSLPPLGQAARQHADTIQSRALDKFFTPQPRRHVANQPRRSLANIGGPAVRFERLATTPSNAQGTLIRNAPTPGTLGRPSRRVIMAHQEEIKIEEPVVSTPVRAKASPASLAEVCRLLPYSIKCSSSRRPSVVESLSLHLVPSPSRR